MVTYSITIIIINDIKEEEEGEDDHRRPVLVHEEEIGAHRSFWRIWVLSNEITPKSNIGLLRKEFYIK